VRQAAGVPVRTVILFGSEARRKARSDSDIDVVRLTESAPIRTVAEANLAAAAGGIRRQFGRRLSVLVWDARVFARRYRARDRLVREIVDTGWVIAGAALSELLS
jgi:predicted nucleotidyltransferase